jgi:hypothetical protein
VRPAVTVRSLHEIVDDILGELEPLRPHEFEKTREAVMMAVTNVRAIPPRIHKTASVAMVKARAQAALRGLDALVRVYPYLGDATDFQYVHGMSYLLTQIKKTPHHNTDILQEALARLAKGLIEQYSQNEPSSTPITDSTHGNAHAIANLLYLAATGRRPTNTQMVRALRKAFNKREAQMVAKLREQLAREARERGERE